MKFYELYVDDSGELGCKTSENGEWVERDTAEQAAKDAVEMAKLVRIYAMYDRQRKQAQAIIERYEGGKG